GMRGLLRAWGSSATGGTIGALSYAFGGPVLLLYSNVIYLVGATWIPFGLWAIQNWLRSQRRSAIAWIACSLAMPVLGGDPEAAYLIVLVGIGQTFLSNRKAKDSSCLRAWWKAPALGGACVVLSILLCWLIPSYAGIWSHWPRGASVERIVRGVLI